MYCKVKIKYKFRHPECAGPLALRSRYALNLQIVQLQVQYQTDKHI